MAPVAVTTDSTHYLPREPADAQGIGQASLYVGWKGERERELDMDGFDGFYQRLASDPELPTTSQPSIGDFLELWEPLLGPARTSSPSISRADLRHLRGGTTGPPAAGREGPRRACGGDRRGNGRGGEALLVLAACAAARSGADMARRQRGCARRARR